MRSTTGKARLRLPPWLWGNDLLGFAEEAALKLYPVAVADGWWDVETSERYQHATPGLVTTTPLIVGSYDEARLRTGLAQLPPSGAGPLAPDQLQAELDRMSITRPGDFATLAAGGALATLSSAEEDLPGVIQQVWASLHTSAEGEALFPSAAVYLIRHREALTRRYALVRVLLRLHDDPSLFHRKPDASEVGRAFASAQDLFTDTSLGFDAYLDPLFLAASPWVWAFDGPRLGGVIVYSLGAAVSGRRGEAAEMLQLFLPRGGTQSGPRPEEIREGETRGALEWWVSRLDSLFAAISDPANFTDKTGEYQARRHFEVLLGVEQLFRHVGSLLAHDRDRNARRVLLFDALDTLEGLGCVSFDQAVSLRHVRRVFDSLGGLIDDVPAVLLLRNAGEAVEAVREVQDGFFLPSRVTADQVRVPQKTGGDRELEKEDAAAQWLRIIRNAAHGFRGQHDKDKRRDEALLVSHTGAIPERLGLTAYLHLLHLMAAPAQAQRIIGKAS